MPRPPRHLLRLLLVLLALTLVASPLPLAEAIAAPQLDDANAIVDSSYLNGLRYRMVGPYRGGRSTAAALDPTDPHTFYMGSTGGGVWKTTDAGQTWNNLTDGQIAAGGIGALAVAPSDANVIWAGTGSACIRGNVSPGMGTYRSTDAGRTWMLVGLEKAGQIGRILVHPKDPDTAWVAALGNAFGPNEERGVFRTKDGGATWEKVLYLNDRTGVVDLSMHPTNPRILYAAAWGGERKPWTLISGSSLGGIYKSTDGGDTWNKLENGLPEGMVGKTAVAVSPANPDRVWALFEHEKGGLYRSDDGGGSWRLINEDHALWERPWYYMHITPDPQDANTLWIANVLLQKSVDGGESFAPMAQPHPDNHGVWINPDDTDILINVNDGGANVSLTGGATWSTLRNQPTAELYRVTVDDQFPYRLYGAQQDNTTISVPSRLPTMASEFEEEFLFGGCESGHIAVDPRDPNIIYAGCYGGSITRYDRSTGQTREITAWPQLQLAQKRDELKYRFQWNAPIRISKHDPGVLYHTSQIVHRSTDQGQSWVEISPDLTSDNPEHQDYAGGPITADGTGVEVYGTIFALEESPTTPGVLWAGSDDGRLHVSRDNGGNWTEITPPGFPEEATVNSIDPSVHREGKAIVAAYRYREADFAPYIFATDDYGATWRSLADGTNGIPADHFVRVVREDPAREGLLYAGTEFGIYVSFDDGAHWQSLQANLPVTPVTDIQVHRNDLVLSTQGRSFWILDDLTPLHQLTDEVTGAAAWLMEPQDAYRLNAGGFSLASGPQAEQDPIGAMLHYTVGEDLPEGELKLEITGPDGEVAKSWSSNPPQGPPVPEAFLVLAEVFGIPLGGNVLDTEPGMHRVLWDLRYPSPQLPPGAVIFGFPAGPLAVPGTYTATLSSGDWSQSHTFEVMPDPRIDTTVAQMQEQFDFLQRIDDDLKQVGEQLTRLRSARSQMQDVVKRLEAVDTDADLVAELETSVKETADKLTALEEEMVQTKSRSWEDPLNYPGRLTAMLANVQAVANSGADAPPTDGSVAFLGELEAQMADIFGRLQTILDEDVAAFNERVSGLDLPAVVVEQRP